MILPKSPLPVSIFVCASAACSKVYSESTIDFIFFCPTQYRLCSSSAFVPWVEPSMFVPLKNMCRRSVFASYPVVAPHVTSVAPYFKSVSCLFQCVSPMWSNEISIPGASPFFFANSFVMARTSLCQSSFL